jgi:hypothetical protein
MIKVMSRLQGQCIYRTLMHKQGQMGNSISQGQRWFGECFDAEADRCGYEAYQQWREVDDFGQAKHCWDWGLSQRVCRRFGEGV